MQVQQSQFVATVTFSKSFCFQIHVKPDMEMYSYRTLPLCDVTSVVCRAQHVRVESERHHRLAVRVGGDVQRRIFQDLCQTSACKSKSSFSPVWPC